MVILILLHRTCDGARCCSPPSNCAGKIIDVVSKSDCLQGFLCILRAFTNFSSKFHIFAVVRYQIIKIEDETDIISSELLSKWKCRRQHMSVASAVSILKILRTVDFPAPPAPKIITTSKLHHIRDTYRRLITFYIILHFLICHFYPSFLMAPLNEQC